MNKVKCDITLLSNYNSSWGLPRYSKPEDAGFDLRAAIDFHIHLECFPTWIADHWKEDNCMRSGYRCIPHNDFDYLQKVIPCGFKIAVPEGYQLEIRPRSGLAASKGITVVNSPGTVDAGYRGEVMVTLINLGTQEFRIDPGDRIAQAVLMPAPQIEFQQVDALTDTIRGSGGFGSTGVI